MNVKFAINNTTIIIMLLTLKSNINVMPTCSIGTNSYQNKRKTLK